MVEAAARRSRLIADAGRSEKERDAEGGGESGEGSSNVLYIVPGAWQISALGDAKTQSGRRSGGLGALACMGQTHTYVFTHGRKVMASHAGLVLLRAAAALPGT